MSIGEKIKTARIGKRMTQSELATDKITRNMLSAIESGKANPSMDTVRYLANRLELPVSYLLSDEDELAFHLKKDLMPKIKSCFEAKNYKDCIDLVNKIDTHDDELSYILAVCHFEIGAAAVRFGALQSARSHLEQSKKYCVGTIYDTTRYEATIPLYVAIAKNINAPLLELDIDNYDRFARVGFDYELYKYMTGEQDFEYSNKHYKMHLDAKAKIKERRYTEAISLLKTIEDNKTMYVYSVYMMLSVYSDMDNCYKQMRDFENAHRYTTKKITLLENLNT